MLSVKLRVCILVVFAACRLCRAQNELTTEQANDMMRAIVRQLRECKALDGPAQIDKGG